MNCRNLIVVFFCENFVKCFPTYRAFHFKYFDGGSSGVLLPWQPRSSGVLLRDEHPLKSRVAFSHLLLFSVRCCQSTLARLVNFFNLFCLKSLISTPHEGLKKAFEKNKTKIKRSICPFLLLQSTILRVTWK